MTSAHPCHACERTPVDHAIICPALGVIAAGRCKRIRNATPEAAFDRLYGWAVTKNKRTVIRLRSLFFAQVGEYRATQAYIDLAFGQSLKLTTRGANAAGKANRAPCDSGLVEKTGDEQGQGQPDATGPGCANGGVNRAR